MSDGHPKWGFGYTKRVERWRRLEELREARARRATVEEILEKIEALLESIVDELEFMSRR